MSEYSVVQQRDVGNVHSRFGHSHFGHGTPLQPITRVPSWLAELEAQCAVLLFWTQAISAEYGARVDSFVNLGERGDKAVPEITRRSGAIAALPSDENKWFEFPHLHW